ncbi:hypothetical protein BD413DRAFT_614789 [Trametes elegans]|nr:hypothetical protein BD413DRAFT_614789 [Trametes elegans]
MSSDEIGTLVVVVLKARNLHDKHRFYKQDAFAQATLNKTIKKTQVDVKGGQHPVWDEELRFPILKNVSDETRKLEVSCWSKEPRTDECLGRGTVDISETLKTGEFDDWVPLQMEDGAYRGELFLEMTYYSKTPPLQRRASKWKPAERLTRPTSTYAYGDVPPLPHGQNGATPASSVASNGYTHGRKSSGQAMPAHPGAAAHLSPSHKNDALPPLPEDADPTPAAIPAILRPGGARKSVSPQTSPKAGDGLLPPKHPLHAHAPAPLRGPSPPYQPPAPAELIPPYLRPGGGRTSIPEPYVPPPQAYEPPTTQPYGGLSAPNYSPPAAQPYGPYGATPTPQPYPPASTSQPYGATPTPQAYPPTPIPQAYPPTSNSQPYGTPTPQLQPQPYASTPVPQPYGAVPQPYGSPPRHYAPPPQPYIPPSGPYPPYGYAPPPEDAAMDSLPDPYLQRRYQSPLPLPPGAPARPQTHSHRPNQSQSQSQSQTQNPPPAARAPSPPKEPEPSQEERDEQLALALEREEEARQRTLREQEERDNELARQLDLELNLEEERQREAARERERERPGSEAGSAGAGRIPGAW